MITRRKLFVFAGGAVAAAALPAAASAGPGPIAFTVTLRNLEAMAASAFAGAAALAEAVEFDARDLVLERLFADQFSFRLVKPCSCDGTDHRRDETDAEYRARIDAELQRRRADPFVQDFNIDPGPP